VRGCLHIDWVWIEYADDFSNNLRTVFTICEDNCAEVLGGNKEGVGICSGVRPGVVDYGDTVVWTMICQPSPIPAEIWQGVPCGS
jgi:hypothetical protein